MKIRRRHLFFLLLGLIALFSVQNDFAVAAMVRGPYLCDVTDTSIVIRWETAEPSSSAVEYATQAQYVASGAVYDQRVEDQSALKRHRITLTGLMPSTQYHYRVISGVEVSEDSTFHTAVEQTEPFSVIVYGDTRTNPNDHLVVVNQIVQHEPDLVLNSGDLVADGRVLPQWDTFFDTTNDLMRSVPYYPVLGNHERNAQHYYDLFSLPAGGGQQNKQWYSFDYGNAHFVCLDSNSAFRSSAEQRAWLEDDLAQAQGTAQWTFVFFHHPPYSSGKHGGIAGVMTSWIDIFEKYGVDMVFNGHDHIYERSLHNGIWYVVTGGGGAPWYPVNVKPNPDQVYAETTLHFCKLSIDGPQLTLEMIRDDGSVGDMMEITAPVPVAPVGKLPVTWGSIKAQ